MADKTLLRDADLDDVRSRIRAGSHVGHTSGLPRGQVQANLVVMLEEYAFNFLKFCVRNPRGCPVLEVIDAGSPEPAVMAPGADLRTDVSKYRVKEMQEDAVILERCEARR